MPEVARILDHPAAPVKPVRSALLERAAMTQREYDVKALSHLALVTSDMERTVRFYTEILHFPLTHTLLLPGVGQHFFFDYAPGQSIAYFWFESAPPRIVNVTSPNFGYVNKLGEYVPEIAGVSAHGTMHHVAFGVSTDAELERIRLDLLAKGIPVSEKRRPGSRNIYFQEPDGIVLEFVSQAARSETPGGSVVHEPATAKGWPRYAPGIGHGSEDPSHYNLKPRFAVAGRTAPPARAAKQEGSEIAPVGSSGRSALLDAAARVRRKYEVQNLAHLALVCADMEKTVRFYTDILKFPLTRTLSLEGVGQHFFFEYAPDQHIAYFWFENAPQRIVNVTSPNFGYYDEAGDLVNRIAGVSAHGTMHHVAFRVAADELLRMRDDFLARGVPVSEPEHEGRSFYLTDPDGAVLEFSLIGTDPQDDSGQDFPMVRDEPATALDQAPYLPGAAQAPRNDHFYNLIPSFGQQK